MTRYLSISWYSESARFNASVEYDDSIEISNDKGEGIAKVPADELDGFLAFVQDAVRERDRKAQGKE